ncbi:hypothetical protein AMELA_G00164500 [Ameiurus melas]|uniref:Immunoglobulin V-set domain-containing protein n=1 Tax=Ameiurus melas TaxID=219545 RepID=A0A7J6AFQ1_AMEME|nr:hypothetical protein AMELA_G00164500 [Ameiurus melas]
MKKMFTRSSRHYRGITTSFYSICIVLGTVCVNPLSAVPEFTVSGHVGSTAVLPCELESEDTGIPHIKWEIRSETVFERHGEETYQDVRYKGRVDVPEEELRKGNCSLVLRNLIRADAAVYWSYQIVSRTKRSVPTETVEISRVDLSVDEKQKEERKAEKEVPSDDAGMKCPQLLIMILSLLSYLLLQF